MNILLVEDEVRSRQYVARFLTQLGHHVVEAGDGEEALRLVAEQEFHLVFTDNRMPRMSGLEFLRRLRQDLERPDMDVILVTAFGDMETAVEALRAGAYDYLLKPVNIEELVAVTERVAEHQALRREHRVLSRRFEDAVRAATEETVQELSRLKQAYYQVLGLGRIGVFSPAMAQVMEQARRLHADRSVPVLICGETGTGKEVVARSIHYGDGSVTAPFVAVNCAALAPTVFESELFGYEGGAFTGGLPKGQKGKLDLAQGGTLFLDEISEIPVDLQAKLLRVIQEREFYRVGGLKKLSTDVRIIGATNTNIEAEVEQGRFRRDLFYRLNVGRITIPPLRERPEDILPLAQMFLVEIARDKGRRWSSISPEAAALLQRHDWPGNVRELKNLVEWVVLMYDDVELRPEHLGPLQGQRGVVAAGTAAGHPPVLDPADFVLPPGRFPLEEFTDLVVKRALEMHGGNKTETARYLGISRSSLYCRLKEKR